MEANGRWRRRRSSLNRTFIVPTLLINTYSHARDACSEAFLGWRFSWNNGTNRCTGENVKNIIIPPAVDSRSLRLNDILVPVRHATRHLRVFLLI
uniref:Putative secreted protein n=1 Tax=Anopheles aquasalis TaxID=42839 RepID=T1DHH6_ANOAQ